MNKKYSILTYIFNGYEILHEIQYPQEDVEYICVTDDPNLKSETWTVICDHDLDGLSPFDKCYKVRFNPWKYVSTDICIRIDGSIGVNNMPDNIVSLFNKYNYDCAIIVHPYRYNFIAEYEQWIRYRDYPLFNAIKCMGYMADEGYDFNYKGLLEQNLVIQRKNDINKKIDAITFDTLKKLGNNGSIERLDQIITSFVLQHVIKEENINCLFMHEQILMNSPFFTWYMHNSNDINWGAYDPKNIEQANKGYFFNKMQNLLYINYKN
ncbi:MAG: hypothetical protein [Wendovervirus sonii]|uniref:Glycosyltransferase n=1 Tax=phage Lak_Megaphage_Sonny TaxID=3109229 RepID=A0ABZ0Z3M0_9CAUD|nr:MAG: hypothetical protein [phage Lak_Megaphage_Sonny]